MALTLIGIFSLLPLLSTCKGNFPPPHVVHTAQWIHFQLEMISPSWNYQRTPVPGSPCPYKSCIILNPSEEKAFPYTSWSTVVCKWYWFNSSTALTIYNYQKRVSSKIVFHLLGCFNKSKIIWCTTINISRLSRVTIPVSREPLPLNLPIIYAVKSLWDDLRAGGGRSEGEIVYPVSLIISTFFQILASQGLFCGWARGFSIVNPLFHRGNIATGRRFANSDILILVQRTKVSIGGRPDVTVGMKNVRNGVFTPGYLEWGRIERAGAISQDRSYGDFYFGPR